MGIRINRNSPVVGVRNTAAGYAIKNLEWKGFYHNECLADVKQSAWVLEGLMAYLRNLGDGPHYYKWQREYLYTEEERNVLLILTMENHLRDLELFDLMEKERES